MSILILSLRSRFLTVFLTLGALVYVDSLAGRNGELANVFVDAQAGQEYVVSKNASDGPKIETFHVMEGRHYVGTSKDPSLEQVTFKEIVEKLRLELRARNFYPAREFKEGDLLLVVHWGVTDEDYDLDDPQNAAFLGDGQSTDDDALAEDDEPAELEWNSQSELENEATKGEAALRMLGFDRALDAKGMSLLEEKQLTAQMHGERYFIIVNAYDWQKKIRGEGTELLWVTRFSVDSKGTNFADSFPALLRAARDYYGVELDKMVSSKTNFGEGEVKMGEVEVIESAEEAKDIK